MACDASHGNGALSVWRAEVEVEAIVLDVRVPRVVLLGRGEQRASLRDARLTVWKEPPERWPATAFEMEGFSATHKTRIFDGIKSCFGFMNGWPQAYLQENRVCNWKERRRREMRGGRCALEPQFYDIVLRLPTRIIGAKSDTVRSLLVQPSFPQF